MCLFPLSPGYQGRCQYQSGEENILYDFILPENGIPDFPHIFHYSLDRYFPSISFIRRRRKY